MSAQAFHRHHKHAITLKDFRLVQDIPYLDSHHLRSCALLQVFVCLQLKESEHYQHGQELEVC